MENKIIFERKYEDKTIVSTEVGEEALTLNFENGEKIKFSSHHERDCCESVYADFSIMKYHVEALQGRSLRSIVLKRVPEMGFIISFNIGYSPEKVFIPCYNYQNGYYSSNLSVVVTEGETKIEVDISDCVEDNID